MSLGIFGFRLELLERFLQSGHLSLALFLLVMFTGVLPKKSKTFKVLMQVRGQLAILGFIFLLPHAFNKLSLALAGYNSTGLIAFILFIPLVFTSFMPIRKKMDPKHWKKLHQLSLVTYFMLYLHLGFDILIGNTFSFTFSRYSLLYHLLLVLYISMRLYFVTIPKLKKKRYEN
jgi:DMSO/TMAO reductase YedYZ heme-binding membrane subunit